MSPCQDHLGWFVAIALALAACEATHPRHGARDTQVDGAADAARPPATEDAGPRTHADAGLRASDAGVVLVVSDAAVALPIDAGRDEPAVDAGGGVDAGPPDLCAFADCSPRDACHGPGTCDPATGGCAYPALPDGFPCDDENPCTYVSACEAGACVPHADPAYRVTEGSVCDDRDECTTWSECHAGACVGTELRADGAPCDDHEACTASSACRAGRCEGAAPLADGTPCDDRNVCTASGTCESGVCAPRQWRTCAPLSACHDVGVCNPENGRCRFLIANEGERCDDGYACTLDGACRQGVCAFGPPESTCDAVVVHVDDPTGAPLGEDVELRALSGDEPLPYVVRTRAATAAFPVPAGTFRFEARTRVDEPVGTPFDDAAVARCAVPGCASVEIDVGSPTDLLTLAFHGTPTAPSPAVSRVYPADFVGDAGGPWIKIFQGVQVEWWSIDGYGTPAARWFPPHDHLWPDGPDDTFSGLVDASENPGDDVVENMHVLGGDLQGVYVSLPDGAPFDLVSIDVRVRDDHTQGHFTTVPGFEALGNALLLSEALTAAYPPPEDFVVVALPAEPMTRYRRLVLDRFQGVTGVFVTTSCNASIDDVVLRRVTPG